MAKTSRSNSRTGRTIAVRYARPDQNGEVATSTSCMRASAVSTRPRCGQRISPMRLVHCKFANTTRKAIYGHPASKTALTADARRHSPGQTLADRAVDTLREGPNRRTGRGAYRVWRPDLDSKGR